MLSRIFLVLIAIALFASPLSAQQAAPPLTAAEIVRRAAEQTSVYVATFKNLLSEETKTFEIYGRDGDVKKRKVVRSTFIVYQLSKDPEKITEYRYVSSVDGKVVGDTEKRAQDFFEKLVKVESSTKELEKIRDESLRFDEEIYISNLTLFQSVALSESLRSNFDFKLTGKETIDGGEIYVVEYRQIAASPNISVSATVGPDKPGLSYDLDLGGLKNLNERLSGKFWIDAGTFQIVREQRLLTIQPEGFSAPVPVSENSFEFQKSSFGIRTPRRISHLQFDIDKKKRTSVKDVQVVFEYDKFTQPDVDVKASEVKQPSPSP